MSTIKARYRVKNSNNEYDIVHFETTADQVFFEDGKTLEDIIKDMNIPNLDNYYTKDDIDKSLNGINDNITEIANVSTLMSF